MIKQYISIMDLIPTLIESEILNRELTNSLFTSESRHTRSHYYYEVEDCESEDKRQLHFKDLSDMISEAEIDLSNRSDLRTYSHLTEDDYDRKPYIYNKKYQVPHIIELEYLKISPYQEILNKEHLDYIENILYQYLLYYDAIETTEVTDEYHHLSHYYETDETSPLYQTLQPFTFEKDTEDEGFEDFVKELIFDKYEMLSKLKRPTKKVLSHMPSRMYACRNLEELLEIAHMGRPRYYSSYMELLKVELMTNSIPLLMIYSSIEQKTQNIIMPSYRIYHEIFDDYPRDAKGDLRDEYTLEEYIDDNSCYNYIGDEREVTPFFYKYGSNVENNTRYISNSDDWMNQFLFPHIMNQVRLACFVDKDKMVVPQDLIREFRMESWRDLVQPETILSQRCLDWSDDEC